MKENIVLMKNVRYDYLCAVIVPDDGDLSSYEDDHVALTDLVEVDFTEINSETQIKNQVAIIDRQITKVMADSEASLTALKAKKQELLAICSDNNEPPQ